MELTVYTGRMKEGKAETFSGSIQADSLLPKEADLLFPGKLDLSGEAYLAGDHLIIKLEASALAQIPCAICNAPTEVPILLKNFYHAEPLEKLSSGVFDFSELLREDFLLELPQFTECNGTCPERKNMGKYLKVSATTASSHDIQFPFADL
jgi:uncharacterized metal-binding protein YceD (DUF177 family)